MHLVLNLRLNLFQKYFCLTKVSMHFYCNAFSFHLTINFFHEATSALDSESEKIVQNALDTLVTKAHGNMTIVIVAHRLSTVRNADAIVVISKGALVEYGDHESLMKISDGHYKNLVERQSETSSDEMEEKEKDEEEKSFDPKDESKYEERSLAHLEFNRVTFAYPTRYLVSSTLFVEFLFSSVAR